MNKPEIILAHEKNIQSMLLYYYPLKMGLLFYSEVTHAFCMYTAFKKGPTIEKVYFPT